MDAIDAFQIWEDDNSKHLENDRRNDNYILEKDKSRRKTKKYRFLY